MIFTNFIHTHNTFRRHVLKLRDKCGKYHEFAAFLCPDVVAAFIKPRHIKNAYIEYAVAASFIEDTLDDMVVSGKKVKDWKMDPKYAQLCQACDFGTSFHLSTNDSYVSSNVVLRNIMDAMTNPDRETIRRHDDEYFTEVGSSRAGVTQLGNSADIPSHINTSRTGGVPLRGSRSNISGISHYP
jgi:hypothetical protein